jgi:hypothetical protein
MMSDLQQLEQKVDRLTVLVECLLRAFDETSVNSDFDELSRVVEPLNRTGEEPTPPTPPPVSQGRKTVGKRQRQKTAGNGAGSGQHSQTAKTLPVVKSAEHWRQEARTAKEPLMFDTAVSRLEPWFKDAKAARAFRETLFEDWHPELVGFYLESLLRYAKVRQVLDGRHPVQGAHIKAKVEALNTFNRLKREAIENQGSSAPNAEP